MKEISFLIIAALLTWTQLDAQETAGFDAPDQAVWHAPSQTWFVSNLGGGISLERDHYGWISRTDAEGKIIKPYWFGKAEGMHAPSGMTLTDDYLYVCDRDGVYEIDIATATAANYYQLPDGKFINDVARAANGDLYISDFFGNKIYKIPAVSGKPEVWLETDQLEAPDGLYMEKDQLIVASWGVLSKPGTFETSKPGSLLSVDLKTKQIKILMKELGNLEGITKAGKFYYITDWAAGKLLKVNPRKKSVTDLISGLNNPTDPDYAKDLGVLAFPQHGTNQVLFLKL